MIAGQVDGPDAENEKCSGDGRDCGTDHDEAPNILVRNSFAPQSYANPVTIRLFGCLAAGCDRGHKKAHIDVETRKKRPVSGRFEVWRFR